MLKIQWLWVLSLLPLPIIYRMFLPPATTSNEAALRVPFLQDFRAVQAKGRLVNRNKWHFWLAVLAWICLVIAASRPQWLGEPIELPVTGRDIILAVDLSGSMDTKDFFISNTPIDRLTAAKAVAGEFIERRVGDRLGLVLFGHHAYVQTPLTFDRQTVKTLLQESVIGLAGKKTAIGDAIGLAVKRLWDARQGGSAGMTDQNKPSHLEDKTEKLTLDVKEEPAKKPILILLTDGANTAGEVEPLKAAELAAQSGLRIYTIGVGADEMYVRSLFGSRKINPSVDLDEHTLTEIARSTGGRYFRARDTEELEKIYAMLDEIEPIARESKNFRPQTALYPWPLTMALSLGVLVMCLQIYRK